MTSPNLTHPAIPAALPGAVELSQYSLDAERVYALERDRLAEQYQATAAALVESVAIFDVAHDAAELVRAREALRSMRALAEQSRDLSPPPGHDRARGELEAFSASIAVCSKAIAAALDAAQTWADRQAAKAERADVLARNKELGLPFHHGLPEHLITAEDAAAIPGYYDKMGQDERNMHRWRLMKTSKRLADDSGFSLADALSAATENADEKAESLQRALGSVGGAHG